jgi:hypothetical protein
LFLPPVVILKRFLFSKEIIGITMFLLFCKGNIMKEAPGFFAGVLFGSTPHPTLPSALDAWQTVLATQREDRL